MRILRHIALLGTVLVTAACTDSPREVADRFWTAAQEGDEATLQETSVESWSDHRYDLDDHSEIGEFSFGETEIEGDEARVETTLEHIDDETSFTVSFETVLVKRDGEWLVDLGATTGQLVGSVLGTAASQLAAALAEGLGEAMEELGEGLADGMREFGEALEEAFEEGVRESRAEAERARAEKADSERTRAEEPDSEL